LQLHKKDIEHGFWNINRRKPEYLHYDDPRIYQVKNLGLGFKSEENKSKEIKIWNATLEKLDNVEYIWTYHKVSQATFEAICNMKNLKGICIKWSSIKNLDCLQHQPQLQHLDLGLSSSIESIAPVGEMSNLVTFGSENLKKVQDWSPISKLTQLEGLAVCGGMYNKLKLDSIQFVTPLRNLKYLSLISTKVVDKSLKPIESLKDLRSLRVIFDWSEEEFAELRKKLPKLKYGNVANDAHTQYLKKIFRRK
jgi:Leucine-rich repeat (LRR) protein